MEKNKDLQKTVQDAIKSEPLLNAGETGVNAKVSRHLKKFIYLASLAVIGIFLNGCMAGYVATEPVYVEYARPAQPSNLHVWINGDYAYNRQSRTYVQSNGYWEKPNQGRTYVSGHWQTTPRGNYWAKGRWQKQSRNSNNNNNKR